MENNNLQFFIKEKTPLFNGLISTKSFCEGDVLIDLKDALELLVPDYTSIDLGDKHVYHPIARYVNHSCNPTAKVDIKQKKLVALKPINSGDEITFDYLASERQIVAPFDCKCGSSNCIGRVEKALVVQD
jgi:hypothetical protein